MRGVADAGAADRQPDLLAPALLGIDAGHAVQGVAEVTGHVVGILLATDHGDRTGGLLRGEPGGGGDAWVERVKGADHHHLLELDRLLEQDGVRSRVSDSWCVGGERQKQRGGRGGCGEHEKWALERSGASDGASSRSSNRPFRTLRERNAKPPELYAGLAPAGAPHCCVLVLSI